MYNKSEGSDYMFKVRHAEEMVNKTFRFPKSLIDKMSEISQNENISLNSFVIQCCEYSIASMNEENQDHQ